MAERTNLPPDALAKLRALLGKTDNKHIPKGDQHLRMPDGSSAVLKDIGNRHVVATFYGRNMTPPGRDMRMSLSPRNTQPIFEKARQAKRKTAMPIHFLTGRSGAGKSTLARELRAVYDEVHGLDPIITDDLGRKIGLIPKDQKEQVRAELAKRVLAANAVGKNILLEGQTHQLQKVFGSEVPDVPVSMIVPTSAAEALARVRHRAANTPAQVGHEDEMVAKALSSYPAFEERIRTYGKPLHPVTTVDDVLRVTGLKRKTASEKRRRRVIPEDAVVYSATPSAASALKHGLLSSRALAERPDLLAIARPDPKDRAEWLELYGRQKRKASRGGPNFFFTQPDPDKISDKHYIKKWKLEGLEIAIGKLLKDHPKTRIYGSELVPWTKDENVVRKKVLTRREVLQFINTPPKELWKHHDDPEGRYYAANVPHGALLVPGGVIDPKYLKKTAEKKPYRHRAEVYIHDGKGNVLANKTDSGWQFPAGGIEGKDTPEQTAKREVLEEAGYRISNPRPFGAKPAPAKWPEWFRAIARAKGRDNFAGQVTHMLVAELGKKDKRHFDKEGDGLHSLRLVPLRQVIADHEKIVRDPKHTHHVFRKATLPGLKRLHKQLSKSKSR